MNTENNKQCNLSAVPFSSGFKLGLLPKIPSVNEATIMTIEEFTRKVARLYLSSELAADEPVESVEVLDALIIEARELTGEHPGDIFPRPR